MHFFCLPVIHFVFSSSYCYIVCCAWELYFSENIWFLWENVKQIYIFFEIFLFSGFSCSNVLSVIKENFGVYWFSVGHDVMLVGFITPLEIKFWDERLLSFIGLGFAFYFH